MARRLSAMRKSTSGQPTRKPVEYIRPSKPLLATRPAMPRKLAALMKSPARAKPFCQAVTPPPATKKSLVVRVRRAAQ